MAFFWKNNTNYSNGSYLSHYYHSLPNTKREIIKCVWFVCVFEKGNILAEYPIATGGLFSLQ